MIKETYFTEIEIVPEITLILNEIKVDIARFNLLLPWKIHIFHLNHIILDSSQ